MSSLTMVPHRHIDRRSFLTGVGAAALAGATLGSPGTALAATGGSSSNNVFTRAGLPKPIPGTVDGGGPAPFDFIHWALPGPVGSMTQILELPGFGLDVDPSLITDFDGFVAYAVVAGSATDGNGNHFDVELDVRVMEGVYVDSEGETHESTFGFF